MRSFALWAASSAVAQNVAEEHEAGHRNPMRRGRVRSQTNGDNPQYDFPILTITSAMRANAATKIDWSELGATTPVKNQGNCGSCWAFSTTEGVESGVFMATGELPVLADQQIISCDKEPGDSGCGGGDLPSAFAYVNETGGLTSEKLFPDTSHKNDKSGSCPKNIEKVAVLDTWTWGVAPCMSGKCDNQDEEGLRAAMTEKGPMSICVDASGFNSYHGGVYNGKCKHGAYDMDHCVQLVGYDMEHTTPYWKVRNSWGPGWGENGYIRFAMDVNQCGVADWAVFTTGHMAAAPAPTPTPTPTPHHHQRRRRSDGSRHTTQEDDDEREDELESTTEVSV